MTKKAFIDIGTNSVRMLIADLHPDKEPEVVSRYGKVTKLGEGLSYSRTIHSKAIERSLIVILGYLELCKSLDIAEVILFSTSVLRKAENAKDFIEHVKALTGNDVKIISGNEEALLVLTGVRGEFPGYKPLVLDIGGGSTEISFEDEDSRLSLKSLDIGALTLSETYSLNENLNQRKIADARVHVDKILEDQFPEPLENLILVGTGGTITSISAIIKKLTTFDPHKVHKSVLTKKEIESIFVELSTMDQEAIRSIPILEKGRHDTILGGTIILLSALYQSGFDKISVSTHSILWGMVMEYQKHF